VWFNDFVRNDRKKGDLLKAVEKRGLNPDDYEEVQLTDADYVVAEEGFFREARAARAFTDAKKATDLITAVEKLDAMYKAAGLSDDEIAAVKEKWLVE
jgi:hypothetical protein